MRYSKQKEMIIGPGGKKDYGHYLRKGETLFNNKRQKLGIRYVINLYAQTVWQLNT